MYIECHLSSCPEKEYEYAPGKTLLRFQNICKKLVIYCLHILVKKVQYTERLISLVLREIIPKLPGVVLSIPLLISQLCMYKLRDRSKPGCKGEVVILFLTYLYRKVITQNVSKTKAPTNSAERLVSHNRLGSTIL